MHGRRTMSRLLLAASLAAVAACASAGGIPGVPAEPSPARIAGKRTLVIMADAGVESSHSNLIQTLKQRGHQVTLALASTVKPVSEFGAPLYDNIALLAPGAARFSGLNAEALTTFVDDGGNLLVAGAGDVSLELRNLAHAFGVDFDAKSSRVIDHHAFHKETDGGSHTRVLSSAYYPSPYLVGHELASAVEAGNAPVTVFEGVGMSVARDNILVTRVLTASPTGYSASPKDAVQEAPQSAGDDTTLVAAVQARNNARAVFIGSMWALSDEAQALQAGGKPVANARLTQALTAWAFQEAGVLRVSDIQHFHVDGRPAEHQVENSEQRDLPRSMFPEPEIARNSLVYRINDDLHFQLSLNLLTPAGEWVPFVAKDVQLEFVMLDPHVRVGMKANANGTYVAEFKAPDVYGIFHFRVHYRRRGLTVVHVEEQVSVRPFRHNEYERFIVAAYPYYTTAFTMMAAVFVFGFVFLYAHDDKKAIAPAARASVKATQN